MPNLTISYMEALRFLQQKIGTKCSIKFKTGQLNYQLLSIGFHYTYSQLTDYKQDELDSNNFAYSNQLSIQKIITKMNLFFKDDINQLFWLIK
ncbi:unnamed protein product [Paramecium sonneborni]|uniref:Uncharacterized protein n=1 Tax=Paramecium sonneborni TaxID=65129 RepID=A0A8S1QI73_9CILI|nr:unnamed protein product [Paramecium sonneborni]